MDFCVFFSAAAGHRMWALQRLRKLLTTEFGQSININRLLGDGDSEARAMVCLFFPCFLLYPIVQDVKIPGKCFFIYF